MADEAFALSPIAARSASPTDADYDAISEAFMETARGRWFLGEYAKRNRNADTAMVLEAVTRLEQSLAASGAEAAKPAADGMAAAPPAPAPDEILASVKVILDRTRAALALSVPDMEQALSPLQRGARIIQEIAWGLRESGSDGRICTILDAQVSAITSACEGLAASEYRDALLHTFDASLMQIEKLAERGTVSSADESMAAVTESRQDAGGPAPSHGDAQIAAAPTEITIPDMDATVIEVALSSMPSAMKDAAVGTAPMSVDGDMGGEQPIAQSSLGASLIAHGIIAQAASTTPDPLAPIRRMSQAEKIAFFS